MNREMARGSMMRVGKALTTAISVAVCLAAGVAAAAQGTGADTTAKPRYASLKASEVNLRKGPGTDYPIAWVFRRAGLPVKITREFEAWREIADADGTTGWVLRTLLSGRRTAQIVPWEVNKGQQRVREPLSERPSANSRTVALVEAGVIADVHDCDGTWCRVSVGEYRGYIAQNKLWGVEKGEVVR